MPIGGGQNSGRGREGPIVVLWRFMKMNRKWWLVPILGIILLLGILIVVGGTGAAPFIYTLF